MYSAGVLELTHSREFDARVAAECFAALPEAPGVIRIEMADAGAEPFLMQTADIRRAAERLLGEPEAGSKRLNLRGVARRIHYRATGSKFERSFLFYEQARALFPHKYKERARLRPPALLKINLPNSYPRCYVTRRLRADGGFYFGPFPSRRAAEAFNEGMLDLFKIRRCKIKIRRDPSFPGCMYSEMKMCMAPCFAGCTKEEYDGDVMSLVAGLATRGPALLDPVEEEREKASEELDFERAANLHKRVEKIKAALRPLPEIARRIDELDAVILQRGAGEKVVMVFPLVGGVLREPLELNFADLSEPKSVEAIFRELLQPKLPPPTADASEEAIGYSIELSSAESAGLVREIYGLHQAAPQLSEHLSLVARWFYSNPREGEILFRERDWPYRRILRACARVLAPPTETPEQPQA